MEMINDLYKDGSLINKMYEGNMPINKAYKDGVVIYQGVNTPTPPQPTGYTAQYLTFEIISDGTINCISETGTTLSYSLDDGLTWTALESTAGTSLNVSVGDKMMFKGTEASYYTSHRFSGSTAYFNAYGNVMSLLYGDNFATATTLSNGASFSGLFRESNIVNASNLILPATALTRYCYQEMFFGCSNLTTAPALPATTLEYYCYHSMFNNCTGLTSVPTILPATTLAEGCYYQMFNYCISLTIAPILPASTLVKDCYDHMFSACHNLNEITCLATEIPSHIPGSADCTLGWVNGVASTGTFYKISGVSYPITAASGIPDGWTVVDI